MSVQTQYFLRKSGIPFVSDIPWGSHICAFFETKEDLLDMVIPYFRAGLENNEFCIWVVAEPISTLEAINALEAAIPDFKSYSSQMVIYSHLDWYINNNDLLGEKVLKEWINKVNYALSKGYEGIRACGSTTWAKGRKWKKYIDYEAMVEKTIGQLKMIALCPYQLGKCEMFEVLDLVNNHQFSFIKSKNDRKYTNKIAKFDRLNLVGKMAASLAHEIRNPMTSVKGFIQLLQNNQDLKKYQEYFKLMVDELDRANTIITEYLSLAKEKDREIQQHNLNSILTSLMPLLQADARKEDKDIILFAGQIDDIFVDSKDIRQVIFNLVRNGLESMPNGGTLEIRTYMDNNDVMLEVKDHGVGIPEEIIANLGTPFLTTKENGTGLGLSVSYKILKSYNATINVKSSSEGSIFTIRFPKGKKP